MFIDHSDMPMPLLIALLGTPMFGLLLFQVASARGRGRGAGRGRGRGRGRGPIHRTMRSDGLFDAVNGLSRESTNPQGSADIISWKTFLRSKHSTTQAKLKTADGVWVLNIFKEFVLQRSNRLLTDPELRDCELHLGVVVLPAPTTLPEPESWAAMASGDVEDPASVSEPEMVLDSSKSYTSAVIGHVNMSTDSVDDIVERYKGGYLEKEIIFRNASAKAHPPRTGLARRLGNRANKSGRKSRPSVMSVEDLKTLVEQLDSAKNVAKSDKAKFYLAATQELWAHRDVIGKHHYDRFPNYKVPAGTMCLLKGASNTASWMKPTPAMLKKLVADCDESVNGLSTGALHVLDRYENRFVPTEDTKLSNLVPDIWLQKTGKTVSSVRMTSCCAILEEDGSYLTAAQVRSNTYRQAACFQSFLHHLPTTSCFVLSVLRCRRPLRSLRPL